MTIIVTMSSNISTENKATPTETPCPGSSLLNLTISAEFSIIAYSKIDIGGKHSPLCANYVPSSASNSSVAAVVGCAAARRGADVRLSQVRLSAEVFPVQRWIKYQSYQWSDGNNTTTFIYKADTHNYMTA